MDREKHAAIYVRMMAVLEIPAARNFKKLLISQGNKIANEYLKGGEHAVEKIIRSDEAQWNHALNIYYSLTTKDFADYTLEQLGEKKLGEKGFHLSNFQRVMRAFISRESLIRSKLINQTSNNIIRRVLKNGTDEGLGNEQIAKNIRDKVKSLSDFRSRTIARTEIHNAATFASQAAAEESDQELIREWVSVHGPRTREWHAEADGQQREMGDPFDVDGEEIDRPGEGSAENSINCRCSLIYIPKILSL